MPGAIAVGEKLVIAGGIVTRNELLLSTLADPETVRN
jgi:hypothetical protein